MVLGGIQVRMVWAAVGQCGNVANPCNRHQWRELLLADFQNARKFDGLWPRRLSNVLVLCAYWVAGYCESLNLTGVKSRT